MNFLTFRGGKPSKLYGPGKSKIWLDNLQCNGNESSILECEHEGWGVTDCTNEEDIGVDCEDDSIGKNIVKFLKSVYIPLHMLCNECICFLTKPWYSIH